MFSTSAIPVSVDECAQKGVPVSTLPPAVHLLHLNQDYKCICCGKKLWKGQPVTRLLEERGMQLRPRIQKKLKSDENGQTYYYIHHTGARYVHLTCVARGKLMEDGQVVGAKNWTEYCAETESLETAHDHYLKILNMKIRIEKRLKAQLKVADEAWKELVAEDKKLSRDDPQMKAEMKELEVDCRNYEKQLDELRIMKWICCEWGYRLCMHNDRLITKNSHPWKDWFLDIGHHFKLDQKTDVDSKFNITHDTPNRISFYEQTNLFRKRVICGCATNGYSYFDIHPQLSDFVYKKTKYGGERRIPFWRRTSNSGAHELFK